MARILIGNIKGPKGDTGAQGPKGATGPQGPAGPTGVVDANTPVAFTEATADTDIASGDTLGTIAGKIKKSIKALRDNLGALTGLKTTAKTSAVDAINEVYASNINLADRLASHTHSTSDISGLSSASVNYASSAGTVAWSNVSGKPSTYPASAHTHDDRYYTEAEIDSQISAVNNNLAQKLPLSGGTINGNLTVNDSFSAAKDINGSGIYASWGVQVPLNTAGLMFGNQGRIWSPSGQHLYFRASPEPFTYLHYGVHDNLWTLDPDVNGNLTLGTANHRFGNVFSVNSSITNSDRNLKNSITELSQLDKYMMLFTKLRPVSYKFNDGASGRTHVGYISQDIESAMTEVGLTDLDFAGFCKDQKTTPVRKTRTVTNEDGESHEIEYTEDIPVEGEYIYSLRYEEFIALNTMAIQQLMSQVAALERHIAELETKTKI